MPERRVMNRREGLSVMSTVTDRGQVRWKMFEGAMNADILVDFLKRLIKDMRSKKVFPILDNLEIHHVRTVKAWLAKYVDQIEVFYLPSYCPELSPDEMLNADLKSSIIRLAPARTKGHLKEVATCHHLRCLQKLPRRVARYFMRKPIHYAA
jgi:transposase